MIRLYWKSVTYAAVILPKNTYILVCTYYVSFLLDFKGFLKVTLSFISYYLDTISSLKYSRLLIIHIFRPFALIAEVMDRRLNRLKILLFGSWRRVRKTTEHQIQKKVTGSTVASDYEAGGLAISAVAALRGYRLATE